VRPRFFRHATTAIALACACREPAPPVEVAPKPDAPPVAAPPAATPPVEPAPEPAPPPAPSFAGPLAVTAGDGGVLVAWVREADDGAAIMALRLDARGRELGPPRELHRDPDDIVALSLHRTAGDAWLAFVAQSDAGTRVVAAPVAADLSSFGPPIALSRFAGHSSEQWGSDPDVRVLDRADGGAAVAASGGRATCSDTVTRRRGPCPAFDLFWVKPDRTFERASHLGVDGGQPELGGLVDVGAGVVLDVWAWHGGPTFASAFARTGATARAPTLPLVTCRPPFTRGFTGAELVTLCPGDFPRDGERCPIAEDDLCARVHAVALDGTPVTPRDPPPLTAQTRRCHDGRPVLEATWDGGRLRLDPPDLGVWTGSHAIVVAPGGARERWSCTEAGELALDERLPPLAL
jgi:hypothetical protein